MPQSKPQNRFLSLTRTGPGALFVCPKTPFAPWFAGESKTDLLAAAGMPLPRFADFEKFAAFLTAAEGLASSPLYVLAAADVRQCWGVRLPIRPATVSALWQKAAAEPLSPAAALSCGGVTLALTPVAPGDPLPPKTPADGVTFAPIAAPLGLFLSDALGILRKAGIRTAAALAGHVGAELDRVGATAAVFGLDRDFFFVRPDPYRADRALGKAASGGELTADEAALLTAECLWALGGALQKRGGRLQLFCRTLWRPEQGKTHPVTALFDFLADEGRLPDTVLCHADPLEITRLAPLFSRFHGGGVPRVCFAFDGTAGTLPEAALTAALTRLPGAFLGLAGDAPDFLAVPMAALYEKALASLCRRALLPGLALLTPAERERFVAARLPSTDGLLCRFLLNKMDALHDLFADFLSVLPKKSKV